MKLSSYQHFEVSPVRIAGVGFALAALATVGSDLLLGGLLGPGKAPVLALVFASSFYAVLSTPRRLYEVRRAAQARESMFLSATISAGMKVTGSRSRTTMALRTKDRPLAIALTDMARRLLLGESLEKVVAETSRGAPSASVGAALAGLVRSRPREYEAGDEEVRGLASSSEMSRETKVPIFMTACFFTPIMLLLYAVFSHAYSAGAFEELVGFEFIVLDLAFFFSSGGRSG